MEAAANGHVEMVSLLASEGVDLDYSHSEKPGFTALVRAARYNHTEVVRELLNQGADATGQVGSYALLSASDYGNQEMEQMLRDAGASRVRWSLLQ